MSSYRMLSLICCQVVCFRGNGAVMLAIVFFFFFFPTNCPCAPPSYAQRHARSPTNRRQRSWTSFHSGGPGVSVCQGVRVLGRPVVWDNRGRRRCGGHDQFSSICWRGRFVIVIVPLGARDRGRSRSVSSRCRRRHRRLRRPRAGARAGAH